MPSDHLIPVTDTEDLAAVHHDAASDDWIVFSHGFVSDKSGSYEDRCRRAVDEGYNGVRFDYRGCGDSDGAFVEQTLSSKITDLTAVLSYFDLDECVVFGSSFGAKTAFHTALRDARITAVIGRAPATYNSSMDHRRARVADGQIEQYTPEHAVDQRFFDDLDTHPFSAVESDLSIPVAMFHGRADESVPLTNTLTAAAALAVDTFVQTYTDEGHRFSPEAEDRMRDQLFDWLTTYVK